MPTRIHALVEPASIAVVGASPTNATARAALENLTGLGFAGPVAAVNPRYEEVLGVPCVPSLRELDFVPDAIVVAVNRDRVLPVIAEAAEIGTRAAVVFAIGFAEIGSEGATAQQELARIAEAADMAVLGPNCQGLINFARSTALSTDRIVPYAAGPVGLICQSGSMSNALINNQRGVRWRYTFSTGNEAVVDAAELLQYMVDDEECRAVCLFLEAIRDPEGFFDACDRALERGLPIVVLKTGRTEASMQAVTAHSGALGVPDRLIDALLERHSVIRVRSLEEMLETANALQVRQRPTRGSIATLTASGGQIQMVLEATERPQLEHPPFAADTVAAIDAILPDFLAAGNPLDYWGAADPDAAYPALTEILAEDPNIEIVMSVVDQARHPAGDGRFQRPLDAALALAPCHPDKLFVLLETVGGVSPPSRVAESAEAGVLLLAGFETGALALGHLVAYSRRLAHPRARPAPATSRRARSVALPFARPFTGQAGLDYLAANGVPIVPTRPARGADAAVAAAMELGFPVVAKLGDPEVTHKTEMGGVITGLVDEATVRTAVARLEAAGNGEVLIQRQLRGVELIFGVTRHPALGSFLIVGLGGIWTEILQDVAIVPVGLATGDAEHALARLRGHRLLEGARGTPPVDMAALVELLECLDVLAVSLGDEIAGIDLNPVIATPEGAWAVDALIVPAQSVEGSSS